MAARIGYGTFGGMALAMAAALAVAAPRSAAADFAANMEKTRRALLKETVKTLRSRIPVRYEDGTVLVGAREDGRTLTLDIQLPDLRRGDSEAQRPLAELKPQMAKEVCADKRYVFLLVLGTRITHRYVDADKADLGQVTFTKSDCPSRR